MDHALLSTDPIVTAAAALAAVRDLRRLCADAEVRQAMLVYCPGALVRIHRITSKASGCDFFSGAVLDDLRDCTSLVDRVVASGTTIGYETYDAWDERGETTVLHRVEKLTPSASIGRAGCRSGWRGWKNWSRAPWTSSGPGRWCLARRPCPCGADPSTA